MEVDVMAMLALFPKGHIPANYYPCDGSLRQIRDNPALFSIIGNRFGGDGRTTYALPNLQANQDLVYGICQDGIYPRRP